jgi:hypothetical protein
MKAFFDLYERQSNLSLEVGHNSVADWCVIIYDRQAGARESKRVILIQECDYELAIAKAHVELCKYLSQTRGGY